MKINYGNSYLNGFKDTCSRFNVDAQTLIKSALDAKITIPPFGSRESWTNAHTKITPETLSELTNPPEWKYDRVFDRSRKARAFDSHGNIKLTREAAKELGLSFDELKAGDNMLLARAIETPGSHHSGATIRAMLPERLERQIFRGEVRDALYKLDRGSISRRLHELLDPANILFSKKDKTLKGKIVRKLIRSKGKLLKKVK